MIQIVLQTKDKAIIFGLPLAEKVQPIIFNKFEYYDEVTARIFLNLTWKSFITLLAILKQIYCLYQHLRNITTLKEIPDIATKAWEIRKLYVGYH